MNEHLPKSCITIHLPGRHLAVLGHGVLKDTHTHRPHRYTPPTHTHTHTYTHTYTDISDTSAMTICRHGGSFCPGQLSIRTQNVLDGRRKQVCIDSMCVCGVCIDSVCVCGVSVVVVCVCGVCMWCVCGVCVCLWCVYVVCVYVVCVCGVCL